MSLLNITVLDQSPTFIYSPNREGVASSSWQSAWSGSADSTYDSTHAKNNIAQGTSSHFTSLSGATVQIDFVGVAVTLHGQGTAGAYTTTLDEGQAVAGSPAGSVLATYGGLSATSKHTIMLRVTQAQTLSLSYATFTIRSDIQSSQIQNTTQTAVSVVNDLPSTNTFFSLSGNGFSNQHMDQDYTRLDTSASGASISFTCRNTSALFVYGTTNYDHQTFSMELSPATATSQGARVFNGTSKWFVLDNLVFWEGGMDPTQVYQVKMTNLIGGSYSDLHSVVQMQLPASAETAAPSSSSSGSPQRSSTPDTSSSSSTRKTPWSVSHPEVKVGVVGVIAAVIIVAFLCWRRRAKKQRRNSRQGMVVTPFSDPSLHKATSLTGMSDQPIGLGQFGAASMHDRYSSSPYSTNSTATSLQDLRAMGPRGTRYSELSTSDDFNPYSEPNTPHRYTDPSFSSAAGTSSAPQPGPAGHAGSQPYIRKPGKGPPPSEAAPSPLRQEVDAGRVPVPEVEETLPPNYDPTWAH
ncbi:hypothetical protein C8R43DRAFT_941973 [Mycena crocata]|nr:hypothetical protein C8R43DRAFT_941973 [Mycena crocata]